MPQLEFAKKTKRDEGYDFPAAAYAYVPDPDKPSTWKIRLWETPEKKETVGQVGRAAAALSKGGFRGNPVQLPSGARASVVRKVRAAWKRMNPGKSEDEMPDGLKRKANFAVEDPVAGVVRYWGKIFEVGDYPDKKFSMTKEELQAAAEQFKPVPVDLQHTRTLLDGKLGTLEEVELTDDGQQMFGSVALPKWLDVALGDAQRTCSTTWDATAKTLKGLALVIEPRVEDAVLMAQFEAAQAKPPLPEHVEFADVEASFEAKNPLVLLAALKEKHGDPMAQAALVAFAKARHDTREGQRVLQELHDTAARYGAVCTPTTSQAEMASQHEADAFQAIHDLATENGATCSDMANQRREPWYFGAPDTQADDPPEENTVDKNKLLAQIAALFSAEEQPAPTPTPAPEPSPAPQNVPFDREKHQMQQELAQLRAERIHEKAVAFAEKIIKVEQRAVPAEEGAIIAAMSAALANDAAGLVTFAADGKTQVSHASLVEAQYACRAPHQLSIEALPANVVKGLTALAAQRETPADAEMSQETLDELASLTDVGQRAVAARNGASKN